MVNTFGLHKFPCLQLAGETNPDRVVLGTSSVFLKIKQEKLKETLVHNKPCYLSDNYIKGDPKGTTADERVISNHRYFSI